MSNETKENFCGACLAIPLALVGAGASTAGMQQKGAHKKRKEILLKVGLASLVVSIGLLVYFLVIRKCKDCR